MLIYIISALPFIDTMIKPELGRVQWPPYVPPFIAILSEWTNENEIITSDMPWAVAWYADRRSLWLPDTLHVFTELSDYKTLGGPVNGLYLTPVSGTDNKLRDIAKGEYKDWALVIQRNQVLEKFPLKWNTIALGFENECIFLSDVRSVVKTGGVRPSKRGFQGYNHRQESTRLLRGVGSRRE